MSSESKQPSRSPQRVLATLAIVALLASAGGCGRKYDPQPPPRKNPAKTTDLKVRQRGETLYLTMSYPATTMGGLALPGIDRVEYVRFTRSAPEFMKAPAEESDETMESDENEAAEPPSEGEPATEGATEVEGEEEVGETMSEDEASVATTEAGTEASEAEAPSSETGQTAGQAEPEPNPFLQIRVDTEEFGKKAEEVLVLEGTELDTAIVGGQIVAAFPLDDIPTLPPLAYSFQVRTSVGRLRSPESNIASFVPLPPPPPPVDVTLEATATGVTLDWKPPAGVVPKRLATGPAPLGGDGGGDPTAGSEAEAEPDAEQTAAEGNDGERSGDAAAEAGDATEMEAPTSAESTDDEVAMATEDDEPIEVEGFAVYRRLAESSLYPSTPLTTLPTAETEYTDRSAQFGSTYVYAVTTVRMRQPLVESVFGEEMTIEYRDDFAPQRPRGLVLLAEAGRTRLVWEASVESDVVGYLVFVRQGDGSYEPLTPEPIATSELIHRGTTSGVTYTYRVVAVDTAGNESEPSQEATTRSP